MNKSYLIAMIGAAGFGLGLILYLQSRKQCKINNQASDALLYALSFNPTSNEHITKIFTDAGYQLIPTDTSFFLNADGANQSMSTLETSVTEHYYKIINPKGETIPYPKDYMNTIGFH